MRYFPPHPTTAPALPGETGNPEIAYFHLNPACCFASKHTKHIKNITRNAGQCPTSWPPCRIQVVPSVQRPKVWLMPTTRVPCHKLPDRSQPLVSRSSPNLEEILLLNNFFSDCRYTVHRRILHSHNNNNNNRFTALCPVLHG